MLGFPTTAERALWSDLASYVDCAPSGKTRPKKDLRLASSPSHLVESYLGGGFKYFLIFTPILWEMIQFDQYFSDGLVQPPISYACFPLLCFETVLHLQGERCSSIWSSSGHILRYEWSNALKPAWTQGGSDLSFTYSGIFHDILLHSCWFMFNHRICSRDHTSFHNDWYCNWLLS